MNAIEDNHVSRTWGEIGRALPRPELIVCMSAHWMTSGSFITSSLHPQIIYDFYGFPEALYHVPYPALGDPQAVRDICSQTPAIQPSTDWGIDHGAWSVLVKMFPAADIPVVQISIDMSANPRKQFELMQSLRDLRNKGILFIGSGNIVHNLGALRLNGKPHDWAIEFESIVQTNIEKNNIESLIEYQNLGPSASLSIPTDDHYRPLINTLALLSKTETPQFFNQGIDLGAVSMLSVVWGGK